VVADDLQARRAAALAGVLVLFRDECHDILSRVN
jgi:hypothetical protein